MYFHFKQKVDVQPSYNSKQVPNIHNKKLRNIRPTCGIGVSIIKYYIIYVFL